MTYLDSSALTKLVMAESESADLSYFLRGREDLVSCSLARVEVARAALGRPPAILERVGRVLSYVRLLELDDALLDRAGRLEPSTLRSLDAIHVAAAQGLGEELEVLVTYDRRMISAARAAGIRVTSPGWTEEANRDG